MAPMLCHKPFVVAIFSILLSPVYADTFANAPTIDFPQKAIDECIVGEIVAEFRIVDGQAVDLKILESESNGLYEESFRKWWIEYSSWLKRIGRKWDSDTPKGKLKKQVFRFEPCAT
ncbi:MAG: hypothetical protein WD672_04505 [Woeseia sp.]